MGLLLGVAGGPWGGPGPGLGSRLYQLHWADGDTAGGWVGGFRKELAGSPQIPTAHPASNGQTPWGSALATAWACFLTALGALSCEVASCLTWIFADVCEEAWGQQLILALGAPCSEDRPCTDSLL